MTLFRSILCPVDFSAHSQQALRYAALLASRDEARLTVVFVEDPLLAAASRNTTVPAKTRAGLKRFVERATAPFGVDIDTVAFHMAEGRPHREIQRAAARFKCDLIVMGAHGVTGIHKMMMGSTTERVLRDAPIPVLAIPPATRRTFKGPGRRWPEQLGLAPLELSRRSGSDIAAAAEVADHLGTLLLLLHVVLSRDQQRLAKARSRLEKLRTTANSPVVTGCRVLAGKPAEQIAALAADANVDLVILTRRRGTGFFGARLGSISYQILCEAGAPVLALPDNRKWRRRGGR
jgi:nucleotide-binding universal stress UspA family protein